MDLKSLFDITKLPTKVLFVFGVISGVLLFSGKDFLAKLHMSNVHEIYGPIIGIVFLVSMGIVCANIFIWFIRQILYKIIKSRDRKQKLIEMTRLNSHERAVLREFYLTDRSTIDMPLDDATVSGLHSKGFIHIVQQFSGGILVKFGSVAQFQIDDFINKRIRHEHLDMTEQPDDAKIKWYKTNRPIWVEHVDQINRLMNGKF